MSRQIDKVLFLPKWYPDGKDLQFGVFLQKHAKAVSQYAEVAVLYVTHDPDQAEKYRIEETTEHGFPEIRVYYKQHLGGGRKLINLLRYWRGAKRGMKLIKRKLGKPDVIHVNILSRPGAVALWRKWTQSIPYVITEQWTGYGSNKFAAKSGIEKWGARLIGRKASAILTVSESLHGHMKRHGFRNRFEIISNIIEDVDLAALPTPEAGKIKFLNISDLDDEKKNVSAIIRTFATITKDHPNTELHIIGGGDDEQMLRDLAQSTGHMDDRIFMYGRRFNDFVYELMPQMHCVIVNSNFETFSVATAEGLINGKPVIVSRSGGPEEFVIPEVGIVIDKEADDQLEAAMRKMVAEWEAYPPQKLAAYAHGKFSYAQVGKHFMEIYRSV